MKEQINKLLELQALDLTLGQLQKRYAAIPVEIGRLEEELSSGGQQINERREASKRLQVLRKEKEIELENKETEIRKHQIELNQVKTNEAYRALLSEIEKAKESKDHLEDDILEILEQVDQEQRGLKEEENVLNKKEKDYQQQINELNQQKAGLEAEIAQYQKKREELIQQVPSVMYHYYEKVRVVRKTNVVVPVERESCGGCRMKLPPHLINEVLKGKELIFCETCSRILYWKDKVSSLRSDNETAS